ncbi:hypothetical protein Nepgr_010838 [Nepenthes gracilis]|uniref:Single-strand DNA endonuclease 1 n=1 Tax=Nepenthes gracilis TaxID=150966 RepID=A0AAD3XLE3_NEPGR|nr:hypothetical protein Nepgr_010838 [Nepenthes gracilis]
MGVKNLWDILESCKKTLPIHHLQNKRVCIDLSCWMVQLHNVSKSHYSTKEKLYLKGLFHRLRALIALNCSLIFVTDGSIPALKISTYRQRLNPLSEVVRDDTDAHKVSSLRRNMGSEFSCMIKEAKVLGLALGIPCLDGVEEAEAQCALLNSESLCDGCFTSDSDIFLFGARTVYRDICLGEGGYVVCYEMEDIEKKLGFGRNSLIALALLLGSDYSRGVHGFGPESACQVIKSIGEDDVLQCLSSERTSVLKELKILKRQGQVPTSTNKENHLDHVVSSNGTAQHSERDLEFLQVMNAYLKPKCHLADSDPVYRSLALHPFQHTKLQQICAQFFGWSPEKTNEYILPKIAERDLRRFANLRFTSSEIGALLPLDKMPIKCPVSEIVKQRRVQGKECFEVSWQHLDGLKSSIVPADLVESACPEKIEEFQQRRAQEKKQNHRCKPRPKKSKDMASSMAEIDLALQTLLLDINSNTEPRWKPAFNSESSAVLDPTKCRSSETQGVGGKEVIDLSSPLPHPCRHNIIKSPSQAGEVGIIDLSDSDTEMPPEHLKKARELRLFLAGI